MKMRMFPLFKDLFPDENEQSFEKLISSISSDTVIQILCAINARLLHSQDDIKTQLSILGLLLRNQNVRYQAEIVARLDIFLKKHEIDAVILFSVQFNFEFLHYELVNYRESEIVTEETTPDEELKFIKAYFLFIERIGNRDTEKHMETKTNYANRIDFFRRAVWPTLFSQIESQSFHKIYPSTIRAITFLNHFLFNDAYVKYANIYLKRYGFDTGWKYVLSVMNLLHIGLKKGNRKNSFYPFYVASNEEYSKLLSEFALDINEYRERYKTDKANFNGFKARPLLKLKDKDLFLVIHWNLLTNKFYDGLFFDFYEKSGISERPEFKKQVDFKRYVALEVSERILFRKAFEVILKGNANILKFPIHSDSSEPDMYFRKGDKIFIVEFKDATFAGHTATSLSYEKIKNAIDLKYNSESKGTGQLVKNLITLIDTASFEGNTNNKKRLSKDLIIYPVIVYTDKFFGIEGVNDYLADEFEKKVADAQLNTKFKSIKRLTCLDLNEVLFCCKAFSDSRGNLFDVIDNYNDIIRKRKKRLMEVQGVDFLTKSQEAFETTYYKNFNTSSMDVNGYFGKLVDAFGLRKGLPKEGIES